MHDAHQQAAELRDGSAHAHRVAEQQGKQDHLTGHERSRQVLEYSPDFHTQPATIHHGFAAFGHAETAGLAYELWQARGCPSGSPEEDWFHAAAQLRSRASTY